ncbi:highly divergent homeobox isoform X1 [Arapaima gigas]
MYLRDGSCTCIPLITRIGFFGTAVCTPLSASVSMDVWPEKRTVQTMNLRSVFTAEQQRILERYYENGMTNQSKSCFQLILQCAQETKLDFSVVRTWVGNKRRKLASKADQNGGATQSPANHTLSGAVGGTVVAGAVMTSEMAVARSAHRPVHLLPPPVASSSSSPLSSSPSSCSSHGSGSGNTNGGNNDVIVTGIYSLARASSRLEPSTQARTAAKALPLHTEADQPAQVGTRPPLQVDTSVLHSRMAALPRRVPQLSSTCGQSSQARKAFHLSESRTWARQSWPFSSQPHSQAVTTSVTTAAPSVTQPCTSDSGVRVQQVFSLATLGNGQHRPVPESSLLRPPAKTQPPEGTGYFSIAMETGNADDEYAREEELAIMGAQIQMSPAGGSSGGLSPGAYSLGRSSTSLKSVSADLYGGKGNRTTPSLSHCPPKQSSFFSNSTGSRGNHPARLPQQGSPQTVATLQASGSLSAPWITSNSRKRTLQDRTQFSERDLRTLKKYWDNGMTSLGSVCREKISAAANELGVDSEIIKTWIGNRRRKYRLMGIEIALPKGGPPAFIDHSSAESPRSLTSEGDDVKTPDPGEDSERNDEVSICLSEDGASDAIQRDEDEDVDGETNSTSLADNVKIEIIDDDEEDDDGHVRVSDMEHMQNLLEFKQEEVRYLESELENQKEKYYKLQSFTRVLLSAVKNMDKEKQQELLASLPQEMEEDWEMSAKRDVEPSALGLTSHNSYASEEPGVAGPS